jgi:hypothetical protein
MYMFVVAAAGTVVIVVLVLEVELGVVKPVLVVSVAELDTDVVEADDESDCALTAEAAATAMSVAVVRRYILGKVLICVGWAIG